MSMCHPLHRATFRANAPNGIEGCYRVTQWETPLGQVVMLTELPDNPGVSVTNAVGWLIPAVAAALVLSVDDTVWIEHYPSGDGSERDAAKRPSFDRVYLAKGRPAWAHYGPNLIAEMLGVDLDHVMNL